MKILVTELEAEIIKAVRAVNDATWRLRLEHGIQAQLPEKMAFTVELIKDFNAVERITSSSEPERQTVVSGSSSSVEPARTTTVQNPAEVVSVVGTPAGQRTHTSEGGSNSQLEQREYAEV